MIERINLAAVEPERRLGVPVWPVAAGRAAGFFAGRGAPERGASGLVQLLPPDVAPAWLRQVHGARVHPARPGACGEGDALRVESKGVAAVIATADCVPLLIATAQTALAVHAGWRGLVAGVVGAALAACGDLASATAWIGPAIGPCCYEVGDEVAASVAAASAPAVVRQRGVGRPHVDLAAAASVQLHAAGVARVVHLELCTRCQPDQLWSHRRDRDGAGRNLAAIWLEF
jgi:YfiH family protein